MLLSVLHPDPRRGTALVRTDVDVDPGLPLGDLRPHLARVTGWSGWTRPDLRPAVHDTVLDDSHLTGAHPLVAGSTLRAGPGPASRSDAALAHPRHVAVVAGPDCGALLGVSDAGPVALGAPGVRADVTVGDPRLGLVRVRRVRGRTLVRTSRAGRFVPRGRRPWRRPRTRRRDVGPRSRLGPPRRWRDGEALVVGATTLVLRPAHAPPPRRRRPRRWLGWVAPAVGGVALAVVVRQPLLLLTAALGPVLALAGGGPLDDAGPAAVAEDTPLDDPAALVAATVRALDGGPERSGSVPFDADGSLAVTGPHALGVARALLVAACGTHAAVRPVLHVSRDGRWRWFPAAAAGHTGLPAADAAPCVVVTDRVDPALARWRGTTAGRHRLLLVLPSADDVPAWCRHVVEVTASQDGTAGGLLVTPDGAHEVPVRSVAPSTARDQLVRAAAAGAARDARDGLTDVTSVPRAVPLGALAGVPRPDAAEVARAWAGPSSPAVPLGLGSGGVTIALDLVADGPHVLVAGTTGAGKSELLTTLVLAHALRHPPDRLAVLLVDFKGGTGLGALAALPHVVDHVTDLDPAQAERLLVGLRAELRRRERLLADRGARDLADVAQDADAPPRLLVVVDELRALVDDLPGAGATLARVAAQGRALGVHLVLATQRPAGAVPPDLRANVDLRIALRVAGAADSQDVLGVADAEAIDPSTPGRALLRRASGPVLPVQVAHATVGVPRDPVRLAPAPGRPAWMPPAGRSVPPAGADAAEARTAAGADRTAGPRGADRTTGPRGADRTTGPLGAEWTTGSLGAGRTARPARRPSDVEAWVRATATAACGRTPAVPWVPTLPTTVTTADVADGRGLPVGVADVPDEQRRAPVRWDAARTHLLVVGGPRSGRTTTLVALGTAALRAGRTVHAVGLPARAVDRLRAVGGPLGTVADAADARRTVRLAELLAADSRPALLLVDGVEAALAAAAQVARGAGADRLAATWRRSPDRGVAVAASGDVTGGTAAHAAAFGTRLALPTGDPALDALAGVPSAWSGLPRPSGRAVLLGVPPLVCQVALPVDGVPVDVPASPPGADVRPLPVRVRATSGRPVMGVPAPGRRTARDGPPVLVPVGVGGDAAAPLAVDVAGGLLVAGPPGSGRTSTLDVVARSLGEAGARVVRLVDEAVGPAARDGCRPGATARPTTLERLTEVGDVVAVADMLGAVPDLSDATLLVDDADDLERAHPALAERWPDLGCRVVAAVTSAAAVGAYRGIAPLLLRRRRAVVLDVTDASSAELVGPRAAWLADPGMQPPGRGVLLSGRDATPLQVYAP